MFRVVFRLAMMGLTALDSGATMGGMFVLSMLGMASVGGLVLGLMFRSTSVRFTGMGFACMGLPASTMLRLFNYSFHQELTVPRYEGFRDECKTA